MTQRVEHAPASLKQRHRWLDRLVHHAHALVARLPSLASAPHPQRRAGGRSYIVQAMQAARQPTVEAWLLLVVLASLPSLVRAIWPASVPSFLLGYVCVVEGAAFGVAAWGLRKRATWGQGLLVATTLSLWVADTTYNVRVAFHHYPNGWHHLGENCHTLWLFCLAAQQWHRLGAVHFKERAVGKVLAFSALAAIAFFLVFVYVVSPIEAREYRLISKINYWSYTLALVVLLPATVSLSMTTLSHVEHLFCQALLLAVVSGLALSYQASLGDYPAATWADVGWVSGAGVMSLLLSYAQWRGESVHPAGQPLSPFRSYRAILGLLAFLANVSFVIILRAIGVLDVDDAFTLVAIHHSMFLSWFVANLLALSVSRQLFSFNLTMPDLKRVTYEAPGSVPLLAGLEAPVRVAEVERLHSTYNALAESTNHLIGVLVRKNRQAALASLAAQVAHDLGSPVAALNVALDDALQLPEGTRHVLRSAVHRIQDITMQLVVSYKGARDLGEGVVATATQPVLVSSIVGAAVAEKRIQYRDHIGVQISSVVSPSAYGIFVRADPNELIRILSNLVNNSVNAFGEHGSICLEVINRPKNVQLLILDNGCGLSEALIARLGDEHLSSYIDAPEGMGVPHAHRVIRRWGGRLRFTSQAGIGTTAIVDLPKVEPPAWFLRALDLRDIDTIVVLDDDLSAHGLWRQRLAGVRRSGSSVVHLSHADELRDRLPTLTLARTRFIVDYELAGEGVDGLQLVEELDIAGQAVLATGMLVVDDRVIRRASKLQLRVVPKSVVGALPILGEPDGGQRDQRS